MAPSSSALLLPRCRSPQAAGPQSNPSPALIPLQRTIIAYVSIGSPLDGCQSHSKLNVQQKEAVETTVVSCVTL
jgi:hypothetical protein